MDNTQLVTLNTAIDAQIVRVTDNQVFREEARYIQRTCEKSNLKRVTDLGAWAGVLAKEVFDTGIKLDNYHLVDAASIYLDRAQALLQNFPTTQELVTLLPQGYVGHPPKTMLVNAFDTVNTSSIYSEHFVSPAVKEINCRVDLADSQMVPDYVKNNPDKFAQDTYVKIDLDGVDINLVEEIIHQGLEPGAIHFEVWHVFKNGYARVARLLQSKGYKMPTMDLDMHKNYSVGVSKDYFWAVGYDVDNGKFTYTYYDLDHGDYPVPQV